MGFALVAEFTRHFQLLITIYLGYIANSYTLQFTGAVVFTLGYAYLREYAKTSYELRKIEKMKYFYYFGLTTGFLEVRTFYLGAPFLSLLCYRFRL
jgi:hypothetical protein